MSNVRRVDIVSLSLSIVRDNDVHETYFVDIGTDNRLESIPIEQILAIHGNRNWGELECTKLHSMIHAHGIHKYGDYFILRTCTGEQGVVSKNGKIIIPLKYRDSTIYLEYGYIVTSSTIMNFRGEVLLSGFSEIGTFSEGYAIVHGPILDDSNRHVWGVMNSELNITPIKNEVYGDQYCIQCNSSERFENGFAKGYDGNTAYLFNTEGKIVVEYSGANIEIKDSFIFTVSSEYIGVYKHTGEYLFRIEDKSWRKGWWAYMRNEKPDAHIIRASKPIENSRNRKWGYINTDFQEIIPFIYDEARLFYNGVSIVKLNGKYGLIDGSGKLLIAPVYDKIWRMRYNTHFIVNAGGKTDDNNKVRGGLNGILSIEGKLLTPIVYDSIEEINATGYVKVKIASLFGMVDADGKEIIPCHYNSIQVFSEDRCPVNKGGDIVEKNGRKVFTGGKWGYVDKQGKIVIELKFDFAREFSNGLAAVKIENKYGFINTGGETIIPPQFDQVKDFYSDCAQVRIGNLCNSINKDGAITGKWYEPETEREDYIEDDWEERNRELERLYRDAYEGIADATWNTD